MVKLLNLLFRLRALGPINEVAVALLLTESHFRPFPARFAEFVLALFDLAIRRKEPRLTMGKCQVSFDYWRARFGADNIKLLRATFDDLASYQICCDYLNTRTSKNLRELLASYNGRPSTFYVQTFRLNLKKVQAARVVLERRMFERRVSTRLVGAGPA